MSLVGSLEDLGLGDILQIISLSGKSGVLVLRSEHGDGQILFDNGLLRGAFLKGGPADLRELLASRNAVSPADLAAAWEDARGRGVPLARVLADRQLLDAEAIDGLCRQNIETIVFRMFGWATGEFSFEVRELEDGAEDLFVSPGVNPQFLALEGTRRADEAGHEEDDESEPIFAGEDAALAPARPEADEEPAELPIVEAELADAAADPLASVALEPDEAGDADDAPLSLAPLADPLEPAALADADEPDATEPTQEPAAPDLPPVVVIEGSLPLLEWMKVAIGDAFPRVHIFQRPDLGVARIRQYLARAEAPLVVLAADAPADPLSGARDPLDLVQRLKRQAPHMPVVLTTLPGAPERPARGGAKPDLVVEKLAAADVKDPRRAEVRIAAAERLRDALLEVAGSRHAPRADDPARALARLREASARISDPASRGDVLRHVLSFAAQTFSRVALFMVRDDSVVGIAQAGLPRAGGPSDAALRELHLDAREAGWLRTVLSERRPYRGGPLDDGDQRLAVMLGNDIPSQVWLAPIQSADRVVAILYGDNLPGSAPLGDTRGLEVVLDTAGMALDRAFLESLAEA